MALPILQTPKPQTATPNKLVQDQAKTTPTLRYSYDAAGNLQKNAGTQDYVKQAPAGYRYSPDGTQLLRTFDANLAKSVETNTGKTLQELSASGGPIYNQQNLGATDAQYQKMLAENQANATIKRNIAATQETPGVSPEARNTALTGLRSQLTTNTPGEMAQIAATSAANTTAMPSAALIAKRSESLPTSGPTTTNPMVPVSATGAGRTQATVGGQAAKPTPMIFGAPKATGSQMVTPAATTTGLQQGSTFEMQPAQQMFSPEDYLNATPEQQQMMQRYAFEQQAQMQAGNLQNIFGAQDQMLLQRQQEAENELKTKQAELEAQKAKEEADFIAAQEAAKAQANASIQKQGEKRQENLNQTMSFQGFGRSSVAAELGQDIAADTQAQIADIERQSAGAINQFRAQALDKINSQIAKYQDRVDKFGDARDQNELARIQKQGELMIDLFKQSPDNPDNIIKTAEKLKTERIEMAKMAQAEQKEIRQATKDNFEFMLGQFGSDYINKMSPEDRANMAYNMGIPASTLDNLGKTQKEIEREWDEMKWTKDKEFDVYKMQSDREFQTAMFDKKTQAELDQLGIKFALDKNLLKFKDEMAADKYRNLGYGDYAANATGIVGNGAGLVLNDGSQVSPQLKNAAIPGSQKAAGPGGLGGQCAYEAGQMVTKPGGGGNMVYGMDINAKKKTLADYIAKGQAFAGGKGKAKVGNSVITNESKQWGHVAIINEILPDGRYVLSEYNFSGPRKFNNKRVIDPNNPAILGVIDTAPNKKYQVGKELTQLATDVVKRDPLAKAGMSLLQNTALGKMFGVIPQALDAEGDRQALMSEQQWSQTSQPAGTEAPEQLSPFRESVRSGAYELPQSELSDLMRYNPQAYQGYMEDLNFAKQNKPKDANKDFTQMNQLYSRVEPVIKAKRTLDEGMSYAQAYNSLPQKNNYTDQALIFSYMKVLDPGSVVRSDEFSTAMKNQGLLAQYGVTLDNVQGKAMLTDEARKNILNIMQTKYAAQNANYTKELQAQNQIFQNLGFNPADIYPQEFAQPVQSAQTVSVRGPNGQIYQMSQEDAQLAVQEGGQII